MKKVRGSTLAKLLAIFLLVAMGVTCAASGVTALLLYQFGAYSGYNSSRAVEDVGYSDIHRTSYVVGDVLERMLRGDEEYSAAQFDISVDQDFRYILLDEEQHVLFDGLQGEETIWSTAYVMHFVRDKNDGAYFWQRSWFTSVAIPSSEAPAAPLDSVASPDPTPSARNGRVAVGENAVRADTPQTEDTDEPEEAVERNFILQGYIVSELTQGSRAHTAKTVYDRAYSMRYQLIGVAVVSLLLAIILFIFLLCAAGHRDGSDTITANFVDKTPFDLFTAVVGTGFCLAAGFGMELLFEIGSIDSAEGILAICASLFLLIVAAVLAILFCMSFATRLKLGTVIRSCVCFKFLRWCWRVLIAILRWCWRVVKGLGRMLTKFIGSISLLKRAILILAALLFVEFLWMMMFEYDMGIQVFGWFVERTVLVLLVLYVILCMRRLQRGAREIARGNEDYVIDTKYMRGDLREHAENLNSIRDGMTRAVNERMKSERFKTELITNVSHDIKTPLTSIVNYVDLLSKENPENEKMREYIEVLSRQSARLKKLIDDLIEASKASTGNLSVNYERCELGVLLDQTVGEYAEKISAVGLELVIKKPEEPITVVADGRHTWRIFDNLMNNICKYAQPGTRVYLNLERAGNKATVTFRNISRSQLNISGDELMERFVRGDSSRNTEGSGLGLSIARSLAQLQRSDLELTVDGDLFKVSLSFDTVV